MSLSVRERKSDFVVQKQELALRDLYRNVYMYIVYAVLLELKKNDE